MIIVAAVALPLVWFVPLLNTETTASYIYGQYAGAVSLVLMALALFLATRFRGIETVFGPMDRVYVLHKWLGVVAIGTGIYHFTAFVETPELVTATQLSEQIAELAKEIGIVAFFTLVPLVILSLLTVVPYNIWKWSHRLIGLAFAAAAIHFIFVTKSFSTLDLPGLYLTMFCFLGVGSYLYLLIPRIVGVDTARYRVAEIVNHADVTEIRLQPDGSGISHRAGQFAFLNFSTGGLREIHPFTIASEPNDDRELTFMVKGLGTYTKRLETKLPVGARARVSRAFGHFCPTSTTTSQVWIGAGIGITPFIAWAQSLESDWSSPTRLYYCVQAHDEALHLTEFQAVARATPNFDLILIASDRDERLTASRIASEVGKDLSSAEVYFCGPYRMRESLKAGLVSHGLRRSNFHNEAFEMRSGLGLTSIIRRVARLVRPTGT